MRDGRFGAYVQEGEGDKPPRSSLPKTLKPEDVSLEKALALLSLPREVARHPETGEAILAGIGRYGSYVQHKKTYANLAKDDDVLEIDAIAPSTSSSPRRPAARAARAAKSGSSATIPKAAPSPSRPAASGPISPGARSTPLCRAGPT